MKIKELKKDVRILAREIIDESWIIELLNPEIEEKKVDELVSDAIGFYEEFIARINNPSERKEPKAVKAYYSKLKQDLIAEYNKLADRVNELGGGNLTE